MTAVIRQAIIVGLVCMRIYVFKVFTGGSSGQLYPNRRGVFSAVYPFSEGDNITMILMEQLIEAGFRTFFSIVVGQPDLDEVIKCLISGKGYGVEAGVAFKFRSDWWEGSPEQDMYRPGYLAMNCIYPFVQEVYDPNFNHLVSYQEFCDRFDAYLCEYYYREHPDREVKIRDLMQQLRVSLGVDATSSSQAESCVASGLVVGTESQ